MLYQNKCGEEQVREGNKYLLRAIKVSGKFVRDAFLTEIVPRDLKKKIPDYRLPEGYLRLVRPFLKMTGGIMTGFVAAVSSSDPDIGISLLKAQPYLVYGFSDGIYDAVYRNSEVRHYPPATFLIELPYSYFSRLHQRAKKNRKPSASEKL